MNKLKSILKFVLPAYKIELNAFGDGIEIDIIKGIVFGEKHGLIYYAKLIKTKSWFSK
jgi:hypothetical protein